MLIEYIDTFLKFAGINICIAYTYTKILNYNQLSNSQKFYIMLFGFIIALLQTITRIYLPALLRITIFYILFNFILSKYTNNKFESSLITIIISVSITYISFSISSFLIFALIAITRLSNYSNPINLFLIFGLEYFFIRKTFSYKRLKNGFPFIKNKNKGDYLEIFLLVISILIIFIYFLMGNYNNAISLQTLTTFLILFTLLLFLILQKTFILYQKQKLLNKTLKEYETELTETKSKLQTALQEKHNLVKSNHEFYHRQEALKQKLNTLLQSQQTNYNSETSVEYSEILDRINTLSKEYANKVKSRPSLSKTNIPELDDMFTYLQSECEKYDIEFILKINADVNHMIETVIPKNKLETLIGDLIRNSIIAINHSNNEYKSIMAILGVKDNFFEFCVHDSGLEFEISTLLKLGAEPASTHTDNGGTGIGFITTFETLNYCKASLIINENIKEFNNYTKSIVIRFDNCNKYIVNSYRANIIRDCNNFRKDIIINNIDL